MSAASDAGLPSHPSAGGSWASPVSSALFDVEPWPVADRRLVGGPRLRANPVLKLRPGAVSAGPAAVGSASLFAGVGSPSLGLSEWTMGSSVVVSVTGEVDIATTAQLSDALRAALRPDAKGLVCDLTGVSFLGAAGLTTLLVARRRALACHTWFDLVCPQPLPGKVIALVGLDAVFSLHDRVAEAVDAQAQRDGHPGLTTASGAR